jgi:hypothetical protein
MYKLKQALKRGSAFAGAMSLLAGIGTSALPAIASADALNPLTERSLTLSSSSPGWSYKDGSGNTIYAPPNSGANGQKTGNFFSFKTSTLNASINAFTFQYCTTPAGNCLSPGNDGYTGSTRNGDVEGSSTVTGTSDLNVAASSPKEITSADWTTIQARHSAPGSTLYANTPNHNDTEGNFIVLVNGTYSPGWAMASTNLETGTVAAHTATGKNNLITLTNKLGNVTLTTNDQVTVNFFATDANYITNPGDGAFFVKINNYGAPVNTGTGDTDSSGAIDGSETPLTYNDLDPTTSTHIKDGGVTVANVMNESISIQTKVLETMDFSVGTHDPDTYADSVLTAKSIPAHGQCSVLLMADPTSATYGTDPHNVLKLGDSAAEYSLDTHNSHYVESYWRLSSNSSGGATVYYTGHTLTNTEGDQITPMNNTGTVPQTGTEQFGLGIAQDGSAEQLVDGDSYGSIGTTGDFADFVDKGPTNTSGNPDPDYAHIPQLAPLNPIPHYGEAAAGTPKFAFSSDADTYAQAIASENSEVVNCVTAKMKYVANIAATTPAGVYTTKINYVAAPQY